MSTVNLTDGIRDFPQLLQSEYFKEVTIESKNTSHYACFLLIP
jgi:hypothetical protein